MLIGLLKTIFIIILIIYLFRFLSRLFMPFLQRKLMEKITSKMNDNMRNAGGFAQQDHRPEGDVSIKTNTSQESKKTRIQKEKAEYVDFEEIKE